MCGTRDVFNDLRDGDYRLNLWRQPVKLAIIASSMLIAVALKTGATALDVDPHFPPYKPVPLDGVQIKSVGSDTLGDLMRNWASDFSKLSPNVKIEVESRGSGTAPAALINGTAQFGAMSRGMQGEEYEPFEKKYGYHPTSFPVAVDALAVYVNKENPVECLTIEQLDQIFSKTHLFSGGKNVTTWGEAGLTGDWAEHPISLSGRNSASGTYDTFVSQVLHHGEFKDDLKQQPGSAEVVKMVTGDKYAMGYSGIGYLTEGVRTVPLAATSGGQCYDTSPASTYSGKYPLARYLYLYLNKAPGKALDPAILEFAKFILSRDGQAETIKSGFYPITEPLRSKALQLLGLPSDSN
jgi:phosphate transport system substrate-binding protein